MLHDVSSAYPSEHYTSMVIDDIYQYVPMVILHVVYTISVLMITLDVKRTPYAG